MKNHHRTTGLLRAFLLLILALCLTSLGVTGWPIAIYAAAPFYFLTFVVVLARNPRCTREKSPNEDLDMAGWF